MSWAMSAIWGTQSEGTIGGITQGQTLEITLIMLSSSMIKMMLNIDKVEHNAYHHFLMIMIIIIKILNVQVY